MMEAWDRARLPHLLGAPALPPPSHPEHCSLLPGMGTEVPLWGSLCSAKPSSPWPRPGCEHRQVGLGMVSQHCLRTESEGGRLLRQTNRATVWQVSSLVEAPASVPTSGSQPGLSYRPNYYLLDS